MNNHEVNRATPNKTKPKPCEEKEWFKKNRYYPKLNENNLKSIFYFTLIWNLFEKECCDNYAKMEKHSGKLSKSHAESCEEAADNAWDYFKARYVCSGETNDLFKSFAFKKGNDNDDIKGNANDEKKDFVQDRLTSEEALTKQDKLKALLYIAFRLRNNLYHGVKDVRKLYEQNENFRQINRLLMAIIDAHPG